MISPPDRNTGNSLWGLPPANHGRQVALPASPFLPLLNKEHSAVLATGFLFETLSSKIGYNSKQEKIKAGHGGS
jgi:hypothetical protein